MGACAFTGIQHYDVIVFKNCFHPTTRVQQNGFFKNLYSEERFRKDSFFGDRFYQIRVDGRPNRRFIQKGIRVDGAQI